MSLRLAIYELGEHYKLDGPALRRLLNIGGADQEPPALALTLVRAVAVLAAISLGLGVVFWIAANWASFGRAGRFALLEALFAAACTGAIFRPALRIPLGLMAFMTLGALFAYFGQTYQTGADPWQLFALWAALSLPLVWGVRSDALWTPWVLVVMTGIALWIQAHTGHRWRIDPDDVPIFLIGWAAALLVTLALSPMLRPLTGAGDWSLRLGVALTAKLIAATAIFSLNAWHMTAHYMVGLGTLAAAAIAFSRPRLFDIFSISVIGLALNVVIAAGLWKLLYRLGGREAEIITLLVLGLAAAGMLALTVHVILRLARTGAAPGEGK